MNIHKKPGTATAERLRLVGAIGLAVIFFSLVAYMVKTSDVNLLTGGLVVLTGLFSGITWAEILNRHDKFD